MSVRHPRPSSRRRLLDQGKNTRSMQWVMAIMLFLTVLAAAAGLGMSGAARALDRQLAGRLTIQIIEPDPDRRDHEAQAMLDSLRRTPGVAHAEPVDRERLAELLRPWLGEVGIDPSLPLPAMIDVDLNEGTDAATAKVADAARAIVPGAQIDRHARWLSPVRGFIALLGWLSLALVLLMASATGAVVLLTARAGLDTHRSTIEVLHMLGSTDVQVARLFQRRIAIDTLIGGVIGAAAAAIMVAVIQWQAGSLGSQLIGGAALSRDDWLMICALPFLFTAMAMAAARWSVLRTLGNVL